MVGHRAGHLSDEVNARCQRRKKHDQEIQEIAYLYSKTYRNERRRTKKKQVSAKTPDRQIQVMKMEIYHITAFFDEFSGSYSLDEYFQKWRNYFKNETNCQNIIYLKQTV